VVSIREYGVLQPIVVRPLGADGSGRPRYELVMGERRLRATKELGLDSIPAVIKDTADESMLRDALLENLHRSELNPLEEASAYQQLLSDFAITQEELASRLGRSRPQITNTIRLLRLPQDVQQRVAAGVLSAGHARAILSSGDEESMRHLADKIVNEDLSVRAAEAAAQRGQRTTKPRKSTVSARAAHLDETAQRIGDHLNTRVRVSMSAQKGQIVIDFATVGDLARIAQEMGVSDEAPED
jgi:ParB family chromosome partitioning protein